MKKNDNLKGQGFHTNPERINKKGAPPKLPDLRILLDIVLGKETNGKTAAQLILDALRAKAAKGDIRAAEVLLNRGYGLPKQHIEHSGSIETPITIKLDARFIDDTGISS